MIQKAQTIKKLSLLLFTKKIILLFTMKMVNHKLRGNIYNMNDQKGLASFESIRKD